MKSPRSLISSPTIASPQGTSPDEAYRQSRSPYRFLSPQKDEFDEKDVGEGAELSSMSMKPSTSTSTSTPSSSSSTATARSSSTSHSRSRSHSRPPRRSRPSTPIVASHQHQQHTYGYPSRATATPLPPPCTLASSTSSLCARFFDRIRPWIPLGLWVATSLGFLLAIAFWRSEVFQRLDEFSHWLQAQGFYGYAVLFILIFITTVPPFPLYSTFMTLSGYCFGALPGAVISYVASLSGAIAMFLLSRAYCSEYIGTMFARSPYLKRVVRAIEKRPNILFLIRLAPYPYNVMNVLLAASPVLTLRTYTACTALSLLKVIVHTSIGASIHSFSHHGDNSNPATPVDGDENGVMSKVWTAIGIALCVGVGIYITVVARRAVDGELEEESADSEEAVAFLHEDEDGETDTETRRSRRDRQEMTETTASRMTTRSTPQ